MITRKQDVKHYLVLGYSAGYGTLHGMWNGDIEEATLCGAEIDARDFAIDTITDYSCIMEDIHSTAREEMDFEDESEIPEDGDLRDDYDFCVDELIEQEVETIVLEVTTEGMEHINDMHAEGLDNYDTFIKNGWLIEPPEYN